MRARIEDNEESRVDLGNGQSYSIASDKLIDLNRIVQISGKSRSTVERWIREKKFPGPHFKFGDKTARWVERLVLDFIRENWVVKPV
jgi:predicted DNA-binding transcriptional regulator AlpA